MNIIEVVGKAQKESFLNFARALYKNDTNFACPFDGEINGIFDPKENSFFKHGEAIRWILTDDSGKLIGRIAAFINTNKAFSFDQPTGGCGFFECG